MTWHLQTTTLAEQITNLADVYSLVEVLPIARDEILRNARLGTRPTVESLDIPSLMYLTDAFIQYRYEWWGSPDPNSVGEAVFTAWHRRKVRLRAVAEITRVLSGHSSSENYTEKIWNEDWPYATPIAGGGPYDGGLDVYVVYADGSTPDNVELLEVEVLSRNIEIEMSEVVGNRVKLQFINSVPDAAHWVLKLKFLGWNNTTTASDWISPIKARGEHILILTPRGGFLEHIS
jgi:hypothetical protein